MGPQGAKVLLFGPFAKSNIGDRLVCEAWAKRMRDLGCELRAFSLYDPPFAIRQNRGPWSRWIGLLSRMVRGACGATTPRRIDAYGVTVNVLVPGHIVADCIRIVRAVAWCDVVVERAVFQDFGRVDVAVRELSFSFFLALVARVMRRPMRYVGSSIVPIETRPGAAMVRRMLQWADSVRLRDRASHRACSEDYGIAIEPSALASDLAWSAPQPLLKSPKSAGSGTVAVNMVPVELLGYLRKPRTEDLVETLTALHRLCTRLGLRLLLFGMARHDALLWEEFPRTDGVERVLLESPAHLQTIMDEAKLMVVSRYHAFVGSLMASVPGVVLPYHDKVRDLSAIAEWGEWSIDYGTITPEAVVSLVQQGLSDETAEAMRRRARDASRRLAGLSMRNYEGIACVG